MAKVAGVKRPRSNPQGWCWSEILKRPYHWVLYFRFRGFQGHPLGIDNAWLQPILIDLD
jgi:hypothetical protein